MAIYEVLPTITLSKKNELVQLHHLPELVYLSDEAWDVFLDFSKHPIETINPFTALDVAIHKMNAQRQPMLLVESSERIIGLLSLEDALSEKPLQIMHEKDLTRSEITVEMVMKPQSAILVIDIIHLKHAQVGHIITTLKRHSADYLLVVKKHKNDKHIIKGLFSASQISKQLHVDLSSISAKSADTIIELRKERKGRE